MDTMDLYESRGTDFDIETALEPLEEKTEMVPDVPGTDNATDSAPGGTQETTGRKRHRRTKAEMEEYRRREQEKLEMSRKIERSISDGLDTPLDVALFKTGLDLVAPKNFIQSDPESGREWRYRSVEDILSELRPFREKYGFFITFNSEPRNVGKDNYIVVTATVRNLRGESMSVTSSAREDAERPGNWAAQISGSCETYAKKYCLQSLFMIDNGVTGEVADPDSIRKPSAASGQAYPEMNLGKPGLSVNEKPVLSRGMGEWMARVADAAAWTQGVDAFKAKVLDNYRVSANDLELLLASVPEMGDMEKMEEGVDS